jgi:hypothetical protein
MSNPSPIQTFCEAHQPPHDECPCCLAVERDDKLQQAQATIQRLEQEKADETKQANRDGRDANESDRGQSASDVRSDLAWAGYYVPSDSDDALDPDRRIGDAALPEPCANSSGDERARAGDRGADIALTAAQATIPHLQALVDKWREKATRAVSFPSILTYRECSAELAALLSAIPAPREEPK